MKRLRSVSKKVLWPTHTEVLNNFNNEVTVASCVLDIFLKNCVI